LGASLLAPVLPADSGSVSLELAQELVELAGPGMRAVQSWRIGEGVKAVSWLFEVEDAAPVVAKFFRPESQERMARELAFHAACTLDDPRLPVLLAAQQAVPQERLGVVLTNCLMGQRLADDAGATEADKRKVYVDSSRFLRDLHGVEVEGFGPLGARPVATNAREFAVLLAEEAIERRQRIDRGSVLTDRVMGWTRERARSVEESTDSVLCHGDFSMWNMLVEWRAGRHQLTGIFDFESAFAGDPLMEVASAWVLTDSWGSPRPAELAAIDRGYGPLREGRSDDFDFYVALEMLKLWWYYAERGAARAAADVDASLARQIGR
jgi:aminoglycoside phosphotransferase (APT) family kinase protein